MKHFTRRMLRRFGLESDPNDQIDDDSFLVMMLIALGSISLFWPVLSVYGSMVAFAGIFISLPVLFACLQIAAYNTALAAAILAACSFIAILFSTLFIHAPDAPIAIEIGALFPAVIAGSFITWKHGAITLLVQVIALIIITDLQGNAGVIDYALYCLIAGVLLLTPLFIKSAFLQRLVRMVRARHVELLDAYDATIVGLANALELRDHETQDHSRRVADLTIELAQALGIIDERLLRDIRWGAFLHDIGKIGIPDSVLKKPGKLTAEEWELMRRHPVYGARILQSISYLDRARIIPLYHHERWNGSGYPEGLRGDSIPLWARIFAVVDVYDAITQSRVYRKEAMTDSEACAYLRSQAGILFDPACVGAFVNLATHQRLSQDHSFAALRLYPETLQGRERLRRPN
jgi:putative nucleotidyltransferase with HDIG domain